MEKKFVTGVFVSRKETAPEFIKAKLSFTEKFIDYLKENFNAKGYVNLDLKESKEGKLYLDLNEWKPQEQSQNNDNFTIPEDTQEIQSDSIPF